MNDLTKILSEQPELVKMVSNQLYGEALGQLIFMGIVFLLYLGILLYTMVSYIVQARKQKEVSWLLKLAVITSLTMFIVSGGVTYLPQVCKTIADPQLSALEKIQKENNKTNTL